MGLEYPELDLPLIEAGRKGRVKKAEPEMPKSVEKKLNLGSFKFRFGRAKQDYSKLGPRIIHLNNPPANKENK